MTVPRALDVDAAGGPWRSELVDVAEAIALSAEAIPQAAFQASLTERDRGRLSFLAKVDIVGERERLPDGVPVEVEFLD